MNPVSGDVTCLLQHEPPLTAAARVRVAAAVDRADIHFFVAGCSPGDVETWKHWSFRPLGVLVAKDV